MKGSDRILESTLSLGETAKILDIPGMDRSKFIRFLRREGLLTADNSPLRRYVDRGYFQVLPDEPRGRDGVRRQRNLTRVSMKGLAYISQRLENYLRQYMERQMLQQE